MNVHVGKVVVIYIGVLYTEKAIDVSSNLEAGLQVSKVDVLANFGHENSKTILAMVSNVYDCSVLDLLA